MIQSEDSPSSRVFNEQNSLNTQTSRQDVTVQLGTICVSYGQIMTISLKKAGKNFTSRCQSECKAIVLQ